MKGLVLGGVSYDTIVYLNTFPPPVAATVFGKGMREGVGSTGAGKALNLSRLGFETTFHALIGEDHAGDIIRETFARENLSFVYDIDPKGTERHVNLMDEQGERISIYASYATFEPQIDHQRLEPLIAESDFVILNIINYCRHLIPVIQQHGKAIWSDIHNWDGENDYHRDFVQVADYLFMSAEAMPDYRPFMEKMIEAGKRLVVCTMGKRGSVALTGDGTWIETPALSYPLVDSNGAGDSFFAGVMYGIAQGYTVEKALRMGAIVGGLTVSSPLLYNMELSAAKVEAEYQRHF